MLARPLLAHGVVAIVGHLPHMAKMSHGTARSMCSSTGEMDSARRPRACGLRASVRCLCKSPGPRLHLSGVVGLTESVGLRADTIGVELRCQSKRELESVDPKRLCLL